MLYDNEEIDISKTNYTDGIAIIPLSDGSIVCIPEDGATAEELTIIEEIKADVESRVIEEPKSITPAPTTEERITAIEAVLLNTL